MEKGKPTIMRPTSFFTGDIDNRLDIRLNILPRDNRQRGGDNTERVAESQTYAGIADIESPRCVKYQPPRLD